MWSIFFSFVCSGQASGILLLAARMPTGYGFSMAQLGFGKKKGACLNRLYYLSVVSREGSSLHRPLSSV